MSIKIFFNTIIDLIEHKTTESQKLCYNVQ